MRRSFIVGAALLVVGLVVVGCKSKTDNATKPAGQVVKSTNVENLTVTLLTSNGQLKQGDQELTLAFADATGKSVDVGAVSLNFYMPAMGAMSAMNNAAALTTSETPGIYLGKLNLPHSGEWQVQLAYEGPAGKGKTTFSVTIK